MAKTKQEVLAIVGLTNEQKERAEAFFMAQERFHKPLEIQANTNQEVKQFLNQLIENYNKRKEREAKSKAKAAEKQQQVVTIQALITDANAYGFTFDEIVEAINNAVKEKKNAAIKAKIAELEAQLV